MRRLIILATLLIIGFPVQAVITYQGQLQHNGQPYTGQAEMRISIWDSSVSGDELYASTQTVEVTNGLFQLDLTGYSASIFSDFNLWVEVEVLDPGPVTILEPRQRLSAAPQSWRASRALSGDYTAGQPFRILGPSGAVFNAGQSLFGGARVGIGTDEPRAHLSIGNDLDFWSLGGNHTATRPTIRGTASNNLALSAADNGGLHLNLDGGTGGIRFYDGSGGTSGEVMRITGDGRVGIGLTSPQWAVHIDVPVRIEKATRVNSLWLAEVSTGTGSGPALCQRTTDGLIVACGSSSRELKGEIRRLTQSDALLSALRPVRFKWKEDGRADLGLIAEEVAEVIPELTMRNKQGEVTGVNYPHLTAVLVGAWQDQQAVVTRQQAEIAVLQAELQAERARTEERLAALEALFLDDKLAHGRD